MADPKKLSFDESKEHLEAIRRRDRMARSVYGQRHLPQAEQDRADLLLLIDQLCEESKRALAQDR